MRAQGRYSKASNLYHDYASATHVYIDRMNGRIVLTFEVPIHKDDKNYLCESRLSEFLTFVYKRVVKVNQERQYAKYYSTLLTPFVTTEVNFNFHCGDELVETELDPIRLTDIVVPGHPATTLEERNPDYEIQSVVELVVTKCREIENAR